MKFQFVLGFILLILALIGIFIGLPYLLEIIKSNQFFNFSFPRYISAPTPGYYYGNQPPVSSSTSYPAAFSPKIGMSVYRYGRGQISLRALYFSGAPIDITGWKIKSLQKGETIIGKGYALPQIDASVSDVLLSSGESADIFTGSSPLAGNFKINNCFGWLGNIYNLDYSFNYCPRFELGDLFDLSSACQDLILRTYSCKMPSDDVLNQQSGQCRKWIEQNMNYNACVSKHRNDSDFFKGWRIYIGNGYSIFDPLHDKIELRDRTGSLIDSYEY